MYHDYYNFGVEKFKELHAQNIIEKKLHTLPISPSKDNPTEDDQTKISPPLSLLPIEGQDHQISKDDADKEDILNLSKFILGELLSKILSN